MESRETPARIACVLAALGLEREKLGDVAVG